ncbi:hypothetical protein ACQKWADRAFT_124017 [Trichoderma austrokoningii]
MLVLARSQGRLPGKWPVPPHLPVHLCLLPPPPHPPWWDVPFARVSVQKNVFSATRPFLLCPASGYFASWLLNLCTPQDRRSRPHRRRSFMLVESSHSSLHNHGHSQHQTSYTTILFSLNSPRPTLIKSSAGPAHVPHSTSTATTLETIHQCFCPVSAPLLVCPPPPLVDPDALRDHLLIKLAWVHQLSCCYSALIRSSISIC